jgi:glycosyltransferase involved in cell wall biosynthesis
MGIGVPKISIALCTYNGAKFLGEQLESIAEQTIAPDEVIVGDDGSTDNTLAMLDAFRECVKFPVVVNVNKSNLGSTRNFEDVVRRCCGDIIFLADQDDIWVPEKIEASMLKFVENKHIGFVFTDAELIDEHSCDLGAKLWDTTFPAKRKALFEAEAAETLVWGNVVTGATMSFRNIYKNLFTPTPDIGMYSHDSWFAFTISLFAKPAYIDRPLIKYRVHANQQIGIGGAEGPSSRDERAMRFESAVDQASRLLQAVESLERYYEAYSAEILDETMRQRCLSTIEHVKNELVRFKKHSVTRRDISRLTMRRLPRIASELRQGNYAKYANGAKSALADLFY